MSTEIKRTSFKKMARESFSSFKKSLSRFANKVKQDSKNHTLELEGKKFKSADELIKFAEIEIGKTEEKYKQLLKISKREISAKTDMCHKKLGDKKAAADFDRKFSRSITEALSNLYSLRFMKGKYYSIYGQDNNKQHNKEDFKLLCKNKDFFNYISSSELKPIPKEFAVRSDGSKRESRVSSQVTYAVNYLPTIMAAYEKDSQKMDPTLEKLFKQMDNYVEKYIKEKWSKQPQTAGKQQKMFLGNRSKHPNDTAWNKNQKVSPQKDKAGATLSRREIIGANRNQKTEEKKIAGTARQHQTLQSSQPSSTARSSSSRKTQTLFGKRTATVKFEAKPPSR